MILQIKRDRVDSIGTSGKNIIIQRTRVYIFGVCVAKFTSL